MTAVLLPLLFIVFIAGIYTVMRFLSERFGRRAQYGLRVLEYLVTTERIPRSWLPKGVRFPRAREDGHRQALQSQPSTEEQERTAREAMLRQHWMWSWFEAVVSSQQVGADQPHGNAQGLITVGFVGSGRGSNIHMDEGERPDFTIKTLDELVGVVKHLESGEAYGA